jgi:hypothetical protein
MILPAGEWPQVVKGIDVDGAVGLVNLVSNTGVRDVGISWLHLSCGHLPTLR